MIRISLFVCLNEALSLDSVGTSNTAGRRLQSSSHASYLFLLAYISVLMLLATIA